MRKNLLVTLACVLAPLATGQPATAGPARGAGPKRVERLLEKLDAEIDRASLAGDKAALAAFLADGMVSIDEKGRVARKDEILQGVEAASADMKMSITPTEIRVERFGDTAVVISKKDRRWLVNGQPASTEYHEANTYVMRKGQWLLAVSQSLREPAPYVARDVHFDLAFDASRALGDTSASVVLYEFGDYECPICRNFAAGTLGRIERNYIRPGLVALVFRNNPLPIHPRAFDAAVAGECAASGSRFWQMNESLFRDPAALSLEDLTRHAGEAGLDLFGFDLCRNDKTTAAKVRLEMEEAAAIGVRGTPVFVIGVRRPDGPTVRAIRMIEGGFPYEVFQATLDTVIRSRNP